MILNRRFSKWIIIIVIIIITLILLQMLSRNSKAKSQSNIPSVQIHNVISENIPLSFEYPGRVAGIKEVEVRAQVSGILLKTNYQEGLRVQEKDILFTIDPKSFIAAYKAAEAEVSSAKSVLVQEEKEFNRTGILFKKGVISAGARDQSISDYEQAKSRVKGAQEKLKTAKINLDYTNVKAPITGITSDAVYSEGNLIDNGSLLTTIVQNDVVYVNFSYPENEYNNIRQLIENKKASIPSDKLLRAAIKLEDDTILAEEGVIDFTDNSLSENTASVMSRVTIKNPDQKLMSNQYVRVQVKGLNYQNAIVIPEKAIIYTPGGTSVYIVENAKIAIKPVTLGMIINKGRLVLNGLKAGDKVVVEDIIKLKPGQEVKIADTISKSLES
ncbi:Efflux pump periplasmic linker BepD precursor [Rickettsiales bacterium Ac37b]|nr:Efflux pump periplasmic linker BepD precursor [Rickettsiales bacterium Ac37b]